MRILPFTFALLAVGSAGACAAAEAATLASLPEQVRELLQRRYGEMGDAGAPFSPWCQPDPGTYRARLVSVENEENRILVRYEHGGIGGARTVRAEYRLEEGQWSEVGKPPPPSPETEPVRWAGAPRRFASPLDSVLPPVTGQIAPPFGARAQ